jgi:hypothetical protein
VPLPDPISPDIPIKIYFLLINNSMDFLRNKYTQVYNNIIDRAMSRNLPRKSNGTEIHHIIPKSLGGVDLTSNTSVLTYREHFICHLLLPKMTKGNDSRKMYHALSFMLGKPKKGGRSYKVTSTVYALVKQQISDNMTLFWADPIKRKERSLLYSGDGNPFYGKHHTPASIERMRKSSKLYVPTDSTKQKISIATKGTRNPFYGKKHTDQTIEKMRNARAKTSPIPKGYTHTTRICPHCSLVGRGGNMTRFHFDNCKSRS